MDVLVDLDREEGQAEQRRGEQADLQRAPVAVARALERPVHREARGDQDRGVDARDGHRQLLAVDREPAGRRPRPG